MSLLNSPTVLQVLEPAQSFSVEPQLLDICLTYLLIQPLSGSKLHSLGAVQVRFSVHCRLPRSTTITQLE
jgi:hypothetical protein